MPETKKQKKSATRRKFLRSTGLLSMFTAFAVVRSFFSPVKKNIISCAPESKKKMVKMLTADGTLVEVDAALIKSKGKQITDTELQNWVSR